MPEKHYVDFKLFWTSENTLIPYVSGSDILNLCVLS